MCVNVKHVACQFTPEKSLKKNTNVPKTEALRYFLIGILLIHFKSNGQARSLLWRSRWNFSHSAILQESRRAHIIVSILEADSAATARQMMTVAESPWRSRGEESACWADTIHHWSLGKEANACQQTPWGSQTHRCSNRRPGCAHFPKPHVAVFANCL